MSYAAVLVRGRPGRIDFPGHQNGFCPDVAKLRDGAQTDSAGRWLHEDVEFVAEVVSEGTGLNDYGPKKTAYALAEVPVHLIVDPYQGRCRLYTRPKDGEYISDLSLAFGADVDMTNTPPSASPSRRTSSPGTDCRDRLPGRA